MQAFTGMRFCLTLLCVLAVVSELPADGTLLDYVFRSPEIRARLARIQAEQHRSGAIGWLPDPELELMRSRADKPGGDSAMTELLLKQPLPRRGERSAERALASSRVEIVRAEAQVMIAETLAETAKMLVEIRTARRRRDALVEQVSQMRELLSALEVQAATTGAIPPRLMLQNLIDEATLMAEREAVMAMNAEDSIRARLGIPAEHPLPDLPLLESFPAPDSSPGYHLARAQEAEAQAMEQMGRARARPMTALALRAEREDDDMGGSETYGIAFVTDLPWRARRVAGAETAAARASREAASHAALAARLQVQAAQQRVARAESLARKARVQAEELQRRLTTEREALLRSAGTGRVDMAISMYADLVERATRAELLAIDADGELDGARVELLRFCAFPIPNPNLELP